MQANYGKKKGVMMAAVYVVLSVVLSLAVFGAMFLAPLGIARFGNDG